nr:MAG TPA: hypothetical protein [Caudoviricetes sp.]
MSREYLFEVVNFVETTRRWYDRGNPRDAGERHACRTVFFKPKLTYHRSSVVFCCLKRSNYGAIQTDLQDSIYPA